METVQPVLYTLASPQLAALSLGTDISRASICLALSGLLEARLGSSLGFPMLLFHTSATKHRVFIQLKHQAEKRPTKKGHVPAVLAEPALYSAPMGPPSFLTMCGLPSTKVS